MGLTTTVFTGANGLVDLTKREQFDLIEYIERFAKGSSPDINNYLSEELVKELTVSNNEVVVELNKIVSFDLKLTEVKFVYQLDVTYPISAAENINNLLKVICKRKGANLVIRGYRAPKGYRYSVLIDVTKSGNLTSGVARLARLVYFLNTI